MKTPQVGLGVACMVLTASLFASSDAVIKQLGASFPVIILLWSRYVFQTTVLAGWQCLHRWPVLFRSERRGLQLLRALLLLGNSSASFIGLQKVPLAEFTALMLLAPVATTVLAALLLREKVSPLRWAMVGLGVVGMMLVAKPGSGALGWSAAWPLASALCFAGFQLVTRRIAATEDLVATNFISAALVTLVLGVSIWWMPVDIAPVLGEASAVQWGLLLVMGVAATSGHLSMAAAIRAAPLSVLAPFSYAQIAFAVAIGFFLFGHLPDAATVAGICLIGAAGMGTLWLHAREAAAAGPMG